MMGASTVSNKPPPLESLNSRIPFIIPINRKGDVSLRGLSYEVVGKSSCSSSGTPQLARHRLKLSSTRSGMHARSKQHLEPPDP